MPPKAQRAIAEGLTTETQRHREREEEKERTENREQNRIGKPAARQNASLFSLLCVSVSLWFNLLTPSTNRLGLRSHREIEGMP
jgi:hypothetical protein